MQVDCEFCNDGAPAVVVAAMPNHTYRMCHCHKGKYIDGRDAPEWQVTAIQYPAMDYCGAPAVAIGLTPDGRPLGPYLCATCLAAYKAGQSVAAYSLGMWWIGDKMNAEDLAYTKRVWRGKSMTVPREQLIRLELGPGQLSVLSQRYRDLRFWGPWWSHKYQSWYVETCFKSPSGEGAEILTHRSGNLEDFLDTEGIVEQFHLHGLPRKDKSDGHSV